MMTRQAVSPSLLPQHHSLEEGALTTFKNQLALFLFQDDAGCLFTIAVCPHNTPALVLISVLLQGWASFNVLATTSDKENDLQLQSINTMMGDVAS